jgi:hypothetical protein
VLWGGWVPKVSQGDIELRSHVGLISQQMNTSKVASSSELRATLADHNGQTQVSGMAD